MKDHKNLGEKVFAAFFLLFVLGFSGANLAVNGAEVWDDVSKIQWTWNDSAQQLQEVETVSYTHLYHSGTAHQFLGGDYCRCDYLPVLPLFSFRCGVQRTL